MKLTLKILAAAALIRTLAACRTVSKGLFFGLGVWVALGLLIKLYGAI